jgi:CheY-like chemotaxis protein
LRLLMVEDEDRLAGIVKTQMGAAGFVVDLAGSAADAVAALELTNYDAAVLDLGLPDRDGVTVLTAQTPPTSCARRSPSSPHASIPCRAMANSPPCAKRLPA